MNTTNILVKFTYIKTGKIAPCFPSANDKKEYRDGGFIASLDSYKAANKSTLPWDTILDALEREGTWSGAESFGTRLHISTVH